MGQRDERSMDIKSKFRKNKQKGDEWIVVKSYEAQMRTSSFKKGFKLKNKTVNLKIYEFLKIESK
jgi:hypothetical protein